MWRVPNRVVPAGKYQLADADEAHGATERPVGPCTWCSTATDPPSVSTSAEANGATTRSESVTLARLWAGTSMACTTGSPVLGTAVMVARWSPSEKLATVTVCSATTGTTTIGSTTAGATVVGSSAAGSPVAGSSAAGSVGRAAPRRGPRSDRWSRGRCRRRSRRSTTARPARSPPVPDGRGRPARWRPGRRRRRGVPRARRPRAGPRPRRWRGSGTPACAARWARAPSG